MKIYLYNTRRGKRYIYKALNKHSTDIAVKRALKPNHETTNPPAADFFHENGVDGREHGRGENDGGVRGQQNFQSAVKIESHLAKVTLQLGGSLRPSAPRLRIEEVF